MIPKNIVFAVALLTMASAAGAQTLGPNLYWPGDFENHIYAGIYSNQKAVTLGENANHTPAGKRAWEIHPGYQHLELIVPGERRYRVAFWAKTPQDLTLTLRFVSVDANEKKPDRSAKSRDNDTPIALKAGDEWQRYQVDFVAANPYPGPEVGEVLLSLYNATNATAFVDDLEVRELDAAPTLVNGNFEEGARGWDVSAAGGDATRTMQSLERDAQLLLGLSTNGEAVASRATQVVANHGLAAKRVKVSADVAYVTNFAPERAWSGVLFVLRDGDSANAPLIASQPAPHWYPVSLSARPHVFRTVEAVYTIPAASKSLFFEVQMQNGVGKNLAAVRHVRWEVLP